MTTSPLAETASPTAISHSTLDCEPSTPNVQPAAWAIQAAIQLFRVSNEQVIEVRAPRVPTRNGFRNTLSGYFNDVDKLVEAALSLERRGAHGTYITLNEIDPALLGRANNRLIERPEAATADHDIVKRLWLPFDVDPVRPSGVSASPAEIEAATARAKELAVWLREELGSAPDIRVFSGNGYHLLYRIDLPNTDESTRYVKGIIEEAARRFSDDDVSIDRTVFNAARIWKLPGTLARKGDKVPSQGRLHRRARLLGEDFE